MENEIKVGNWIRDREGNITKIIQTLSLFKGVELYLGEDGYQYSDNAIVKHSSNLIDLIQCGDYVNGEQVCKSRYDELYTSYVYCGGIGVRTTEAYTTFIKDMKEEDIETIVTKEMMESISYKVTKM